MFGTIAPTLARAVVPTHDPSLSALHIISTFGKFDWRRLKYSLGAPAFE